MYNRDLTSAKLVQNRCNLVHLVQNENIEEKRNYTFYTDFTLLFALPNKLYIRNIKKFSVKGVKIFKNIYTKNCF